MTSTAAVERATRRVVEELAPLRFQPPVACVYAPLEYASRPHREYVRRYGAGPKEIVLVGMNPGPFGMAQTGVPFGEVAMVRGWLGIDAPVDKPAVEHPKRPVQGFACTRSEVSGKRLWSWCRDRFDTPQQFFARFWIHNYCPLAFMTDSGSNLTPDKLPRASRDELFSICDRYLRAVVDALSPRLVVGVGAFAEQRATHALAGRDGLAFGRIPHPSPASPAANRGWEALADRAFAELDVRLDRGDARRHAR